MASSVTPGPVLAPLPRVPTAVELKTARTVLISPTGGAEVVRPLDDEMAAILSDRTGSMKFLPMLWTPHWKPVDAPAGWTAQDAAQRRTNNANNAAAQRGLLLHVFVPRTTAAVAAAVAADGSAGVGIAAGDAKAKASTAAAAAAAPASAADQKASSASASGSGSASPSASSSMECIGTAGFRFIGSLEDFRAAEEAASEQCDPKVPPITPFAADCRRVAEWGTILAAAQCHRGIGAEVHCTGLDFGFTALAIDAVFFSTDRDNAAQRAFYQRFGIPLVSQGRGPWATATNYVLTRAQWPEVKRRMEAHIAERAAARAKN
jgi:RimJ/RimL family protein N-acetyltransferase